MEEIKFNDIVQEFFRNLEKIGCAWLKNFLISRYQGLPVSLRTEERAYNYFLANSVITAATAANKGGSITTEFFYDGLRKPSLIDSYLLKSLAGQAVKLRLDAIEKYLGSCINSKGFLIGNFGSGPGRDTIDVLSGGKYLGSQEVKAVCIDRDERALERGRIMAAVREVSHRIDFVEGDFLKNHLETGKRFDLVLMIGILCPLEPRVCEIFLKKVLHSGVLKDNGLIIVSNASPEMLAKDPFTCFLMKWTAGWELVYKNEETLKSIFEDSGFQWMESFRDSLGFHIMGVGSLPKT